MYEVALTALISAFFVDRIMIEKIYIDASYLIGYNHIRRLVQEIERLFVNTDIFDKQWESIGLDDEDLRNLQSEILKNPKIGNVIKGTNGLRKIRIPLDNRGKRDGARVLYVDIVVTKVIYLIFAYSKGEKDNINQDERKAFKALITEIKKEYGDTQNE